MDEPHLLWSHECFTAPKGAGGAADTALRAAASLAAGAAVRATAAGDTAGKAGADDGAEDGAAVAAAEPNEPAADGITQEGKREL